jgi:hypothetical protein
MARGVSYESMKGLLANAHPLHPSVTATVMRRWWRRAPLHAGDGRPALARHQTPELNSGPPRALADAGTIMTW